jgi:hypothetical protein
MIMSALYMTDTLSFLFYRACSLKQQSVGRCVAPLRHLILKPTQSVFALNPSNCMLTREAAKTIFIVFGLSWPSREPITLLTSPCTKKWWEACCLYRWLFTRIQDFSWQCYDTYSVTWGIWHKTMRQLQIGRNQQVTILHNISLRQLGHMLLANIWKLIIKFEEIQERIT